MNLRLYQAHIVTLMRSLPSGVSNDKSPASDPVA